MGTMALDSTVASGMVVRVVSNALFCGSHIYSHSNHFCVHQQNSTGPFYMHLHKHFLWPLHHTLPFTQKVGDSRELPPSMRHLQPMTIRDLVYKYLAPLISEVCILLCVAQFPHHNKAPFAHCGNGLGEALFWLSFLPCLISTLSYQCLPHLPNKLFALKSLSQRLPIGRTQTKIPDRTLHQGCPCLANDLTD